MLPSIRGCGLCLSGRDIKLSREANLFIRLFGLSSARRSSSILGETSHAPVLCCWWESVAIPVWLCSTKSCEKQIREG